MAVHPSKRRKLEHSSSDEGSQDGMEIEEGDRMESAEEDSGEEDANLNHKNPGAKKASQIDYEALYAGGLYKSSMFRLQIDEMLAEERPNYEKFSSTIEAALAKIKAIIEAIPEREPLSIPEATKLMKKSHKIEIPYPDPKPKKDAANKLAYAKPAKINVAGSYVLKTMVKSDAKLGVDMVVTIPESILQEKDYRDYRYFYKRAYYLSCIAAGLQESQSKDFKLQFEYLNGNSLQPIIVLKFGTDGDAKNKKFDIHVIPAAPGGFFKETKLRPSQSAIRHGEDPSKAVSTPFYNATLQSDAAIAKHIALLSQASKQAAGFTEACILGRIWLRQRGFGGRISKGGFGHFEWATLMALLLRGGGSQGRPVLSSGYSSYQLFKAVVQYLAARDLVANPVVTEASDVQLARNGTPIFYDGHLNILFKMSAWSYASLRDGAKTSLEMLNDAAFDQFGATFISKSDSLLLRFDRFIRVAVPSKSIEETGDHQDLFKRTCDKLYAVLKEGLTDRIRAIEIKTPDSSSWSVKATPPQSSNQDTLLVGFAVDPTNVDRIRDRGPAAVEKKQSIDFQNFWGDKAELRKMNDGEIIETVLWEQSEVSPFRQIISYTLKKHLGIHPGTDLTFHEQLCAQLLPDSDVTTSFDNLKEAYRQFETDIRDLERLPLQLRQLSPVDPQLRYTSLHAPVFSPHQYLKTPAEVLIQFEGSARWPDDIVAIQRTKIAFLLKIAELMQESVDGLSARVGLENSPSASPSNQFLNVAFLDVYYPSGAVFRLRIHNEREQILLERLIKDKSADSRTMEEARSALAIYKRDFIQLPLLTQSISTHCTRFPSLSATIRLVKKWFGAHLLSSHVPDAVIEILSIRTFLHPFPWNLPSSATTGFMRTLQWVGKWDWRLQPLVVDFSGTMTDVDVKNFETTLEAWRKVDSAMNHTVLIVGTNHDQTGIAFTRDGPSTVAAARMTALARSATKVMGEKGMDLDIQSLFRSSMAPYDFTIHFETSFTAGKEKKKKSSSQQFKNLALQEAVDTEVIGLEPVNLYISELGQLYRECVVLFHEGGGNFVAGLWNPLVGMPRKFKVNTGFAAKPCPGKNEGEDSDDEGDEKEEAKVMIDREAILAEMARLGGDMIKTVTVKGS